MSFWIRVLLSVLISTVIFVSAKAQTPQPDDEDLQSWNDVQIAVPLNKKVDLLLLTTIRFANDLALFSEARGGAGLNIKVNDAISVSPSYLYIESRTTAGPFRTEHRYNLRGTYKFPIKKFGLSHRSQYEYRVRNSGNSWRYRPSLTFEKALPEKVIPKAKLFVTEEVFYDSSRHKFTRNRFSVGVSKALNDNLTLDVYYLRQSDGTAHPGDLNVIGTSWKVHF